MRQQLSASKAVAAPGQSVSSDHARDLIGTTSRHTPPPRRREAGVEVFEGLAARGAVDLVAHPDGHLAVSDDRLDVLFGSREARRERPVGRPLVNAFEAMMDWWRQARDAHR